MKNEKEYLMLRDEITWRLKVIDTLGTFTYTIFVSILGVALTTNIIELLLLPYVVIVPISLKVANHKYSVGYIAAYLNKFLENCNEEDSFKWEKMHITYYETNPRTLREKVIYYGSSAEYASMIILTTVIFWIKYFHRSELKFSLLQIHGYIAVQTIIIFLVLYITISYMSFQKTKPALILNWDKVKL
ncbi:MAG: hypothetical protein HFH73_09355 [Lachnospiraceae bacterium]|nr:hypothetical protein [Lachnospiraceae bacterium]